ncbi:hypothetical protein NRIC_14870 [Enterococcus florum]|uniref:Uncharacterized protein n=1 Tax=Enterococcus florum TaxID=2480627 RepID=A0A4P5P7W3_9ENTE|nr:hypothetical protein [Enterococcus florum]GCF93596.1 hypothetical protein NRIC_14870 [Enterococcus florum]
MTPAERLSNALAPIIAQEAMPLVTRTDSLELSRELSVKMNKAVARELLVMDAMNRTADIDAYRATLQASHPEAEIHLKYLTDVFVYLTARDFE